MPALRKQALDSLRNIAEHVAAANGATVDAEIPAPGSNPVNYNDPALTLRVSLNVALTSRPCPWISIVSGFCSLVLVAIAVA